MRPVRLVHPKVETPSGTGAKLYRLRNDSRGWSQQVARRYPRGPNRRPPGGSDGARRGVNPKCTKGQWHNVRRANANMGLDVL